VPQSPAAALPVVETFHSLQGEGLHAGRSAFFIRLGFGPTVPGARQLVNHGHVTVNNRVVDIPSFQCRAGDVVAIRERKCSKTLAEANMAFPGLANIPPHLEFDKAKMTAKVGGRIEREWVALEINELLVVEFYSRKV
jgi:small subunit ribosomal protein S4